MRFKNDLNAITSNLTKELVQQYIEKSKQDALLELQKAAALVETLLAQQTIKSEEKFKNRPEYQRRLEVIKSLESKVSTALVLSSPDVSYLDKNKCSAGCKYGCKCSSPIIIDHLPYDITNPGVYKVSENLDFTPTAPGQTAITIQASFVTVFSKHKTITQTDQTVANCIGISINPANSQLTNIELIDITLDHFSLFGIAIFGAVNQLKINKMNAQFSGYNGEYILPTPFSIFPFANTPTVELSGGLAILYTLSTTTPQTTIGATNVLIKKSSFNNSYSNNLLPLTTFTVLGGSFIAGAQIVEIRDSEFNNNTWVNMPNSNTRLVALSFYPISNNVEIKNCKFNQNSIRNGPGRFDIIAIFGNDYEVTDCQVNGNSTDTTAGTPNFGVLASSTIIPNSLNLILRNIIMSDLTANIAGGFVIEFVNNAILYKCVVQNLHDLHTGGGSVSFFASDDNVVKHIDCAVENMTVATTGSGVGFLSESSINVQYKGCKASEITGDGFDLFDNDIYNVTNCSAKNNTANGYNSKSCNYKNCQAISNGSEGFNLFGSNNNVSNCLASQNGDIGFNVNSNAVFTDSESSFNKKIGFNLYNSNHTVSDCLASNNGTDGFSVGANAIFTNTESSFNKSSGFNLYNNNYIMSDCVATENGLDGFVINANTTITNSKSSSNGMKGFNLYASNYTLTECTASNNTDDGFAVGDNSSINDSESLSNGNNGFNLFSIGYIVNDSVAAKNADGFVIGFNSLVKKCLAKKNSGSGFIVFGSNDLLSCDVAKSNGGDGFVVFGPNNTIKYSVALKNGGVGFHNEAASNIYKHDKGRKNAGGNYATTVPLSPIYVDIENLEGPFDTEEYIRCCPECC